MNAERFAAEQAEPIEGAIYMKIDETGSSKMEVDEVDGNQASGSASGSSKIEEDGPFKGMANESFHSGVRPTLAEVCSFSDIFSYVFRDL